MDHTTVLHSSSTGTCSKLKVVPLQYSSSTAVKNLVGTVGTVPLLEGGEMLP